MILVNPFNGKTVGVTEKATADRLIAGGFTKQETKTPAKKPAGDKE